MQADMKTRESKTKKKGGGRDIENNPITAQQSSEVYNVDPTRFSLLREKCILS